MASPQFSMTRSIIIGAVFGFLWAFVPMVFGGLAGSLGEMFSAIVSGVLTGSIVSSMLGALLVPKDPVKTIFIGVGSLPLGAFVFGVVISFVHLILQVSIGTSYRFIENGFEPLMPGFQYAAYSILYFPLGIVLVPLAIGTTFLLAWVMNYNTETGPQAKPFSYR